MHLFSDGNGGVYYSFTARCDSKSTAAAYAILERAFNYDANDYYRSKYPQDTYYEGLLPIPIPATIPNEWIPDWLLDLPAWLSALSPTVSPGLLPSLVPAF